MAQAPDWRQVTDPHKHKVLEALADARWDFRTLRGISDATRLDEKEVATLLNELQDYVRESSIRGKDGERLYRLIERGPVRNEQQQQFKRFLGMRGG